MTNHGIVSYVHNHMGTSCLLFGLTGTGAGLLGHRSFGARSGGTQQAQARGYIRSDLRDAIPSLTGIGGGFRYSNSIHPHFQHHDRP